MFDLIFCNYSARSFIIPVRWIQNNLSQDNYFDFNYLGFAAIQIKIVIKIEATFDR